MGFNLGFKGLKNNKSIKLCLWTEALNKWFELKQYTNMAALTDIITPMMFPIRRVEQF